MAASDKRTSGAPFRPPPANMWNAMVAAGEAHQMQQLGSGGAPPPRPRRTDVIKCKNNSGAARARGEVLGTFSKSVTNLDPGNIQLVGAAPTTGKHFGILLKALPSGDTGELQLSGVCPATVTVGDIAHQYADLDPGVYKLVSAETGPIHILWQPGSTGDQECFVRFGGGSGFVGYRFTLTSSMSTGTGTADIYEMDGTTSVESGSAISVGMGAFTDLLTGDKGWCWKQAGTYYIGNAGCPGTGI